MIANGNEGYRFLEHTSDALVEAWAPTIERAFAQAAAGLFETMLNLKSVKPTIEETVEATGRDEVELLYDWLEELLLKFELRGMVYSAFDIDPLARVATRIQLHAQVRGERYDRAKHGGKTEVKGVTYHLMTVERHGGQVHLRFLLDL